MAPSTRSTGNRILDRLHENERDLLMEFARTVSFQRGSHVYQQDGPLPHAYFPTTGVFGIVLFVGDGQQIEAATIGNEGMLGLPLFLDVDFAPEAVLSQVTGEAIRIPADRFQAVAKASSSIDRVLRHYAAFRLRTKSQSVACQSMHSLEERLCRWLLTAHDRAGVDEFEITHEFLAELLGVRRQSISLLTATLQHSGLISCRRSAVRILDRSALMSASCECYEDLKHMYDRIMG
jgi:CRP-like cAMP-binding protein